MVQVKTNLRVKFFNTTIFDIVLFGFCGMMRLWVEFLKIRVQKSCQIDGQLRARRP